MHRRVLFTVNSTYFLKKELAFVELEIGAEHILHDGNNLSSLFLPI